MPHFESLERKTRLHSTASQAEPIRDLCRLRLPSRSQSATWVKPGIAHSRYAAPHRTAAPRWPAGWLPGASARSSLDASSSTHESGSKSNALTLTLSGPQVQALSTRAPGISDEAVRRRRAPTTAAPPRPSPVVQAFDAGRHRRERRRQTKVHTSPSVAGHAPTSPFERRS
jgi:hypothetical protein